MPEEDITVTYTSPDLDNSYRDIDIVLEKVSIPESFYAHISRDYKCEEVLYSLNDLRAYQAILSSNCCTIGEPTVQFPCQDASCQSNEAKEFPTQSGTQTKTIGRKINNSKEKNRVCEFITVSFAIFYFFSENLFWCICS